MVIGLAPKRTYLALVLTGRARVRRQDTYVLRNLPVIHNPTCLQLVSWILLTKVLDTHTRSHSSWATYSGSFALAQWGQSRDERKLKHTHNGQFHISQSLLSVSSSRSMSSSPSSVESSGRLAGSPPGLPNIEDTMVSKRKKSLCHLNTMCLITYMLIWSSCNVLWSNFTCWPLKVRLLKNCLLYY